MRWLATVAGVIGGITACFGGFFGLFKGAISLDAVEFIGYAIMLFLGFLIFVMEGTDSSFLLKDDLILKLLLFAAQSHLLNR